MQLRAARQDDLFAVTAIYNAGIAERGATFETSPRSVSDIADWLPSGRPFVVAEHDSRVIGWARAGVYSDRRVFAGIGEQSVYVSPSARSLGAGTALLVALCEASEAHGLHKLVNRVFADNEASRAAHRAAGFREVGLMERHARVDGVWRDCILVERLLGDAS